MIRRGEEQCRGAGRNHFSQRARSLCATNSSCAPSVQARDLGRAAASMGFAKEHAEIDRGWYPERGIPPSAGSPNRQTPMPSQGPPTPSHMRGTSSSARMSSPRGSSPAKRGPATRKNVAEEQRGDRRSSHGERHQPASLQRTLPRMPQCCPTQPLLPSEAQRWPAGGRHIRTGCCVLCFVLGGHSDAVPMRCPGLPWLLLRRLPRLVLCVCVCAYAAARSS